MIKTPSIETLYKWIYEDAESGGKLYSYLARSHKKRKQHKIKTRLGAIQNRTPINLRPEVVNGRERIGDFEADSMVSCGNKAGILTATERKSRLFASTKVSSKSVADTNKAIFSMLKSYNPKTITSDNGFEFAGHKALSRKLGYKHYHADPYASYQRGSNEHSHRMLRRYFPKGTDFNKVTEDELQQAVLKINRLPTKIHQGLSAYKVYYGINLMMFTNTHKELLNFAFRT